MAYSYKIEDIEGIGPAYAAKLQEIGIKTTVSFLNKCATKKGRSEVSEATGIDDSKILKWTNHADLTRVKGVAGQTAELLETVGVDTVKEFRTRNAKNLKTKIDELIATGKNIIGKIPSESQLQEMIDHAKTLEPMVTH